MDNINMKNKLKTLEDLLKNHDWFYYYSDDFSVYESGQRSFDKINELIELLENNDLGKEANDLYEKYEPEALKY
jgi:IS1 family transposase